jgi:septum formation protein
MSSTAQQARIILASASPRRRQLLGELGLEFEVRPSHVNEDALPGETPLETQKRVTLAKALVGGVGTPPVDAQVQHVSADSIVIACDTTVLIDGEMLNKPADAIEAWAMLTRLRGREHEVQSVLVVRQAQQVDLDVVTSAVRMREYSDAEIAAYIASGDPFDKAGSYAVQHAEFRPVAEIRACPLNVIGLPLCVLRMRLMEKVRIQRETCSAVCQSWFGAACAAHPNDRTHAVTRVLKEP